MSRYFASRDRPKGRDAFREVPHRIAASGSPILDGVGGVHGLSRCTPRTRPGDHLIFIGEVLELDVQDGGTPLVFHGGGYRLLEPPLGA